MRYRLGCATRRSALPRERFSPLAHRKCTAKLTMSVDGGKADLMLGYVEVSV